MKDILLIYRGRVIDTEIKAKLEHFKDDNIILVVEDEITKNVVNLILRNRSNLTLMTSNYFLDDNNIILKFMKFDVIVGNPPYQKRVGPNKTEPIWDKFVQKCIKLLKSGGTMELIHPSGWRNIDGRFKHIKNLLLSKQIEYIEMHDVSDGMKTFGAATRYDIYKLINTKPFKNTNVKFENGLLKNMNLSDFEFIPNIYYENINNVISDSIENKVDFLYSRSDYGSDKPHMNKKYSSTHPYACVQNVDVNHNISCFWYSNNKNNGHFGIPKVIFGRKSAGVLFDREGKYGLSQDCAAIIDSIENLEIIESVLKSNKFLDFMKAFDFGGVNDRYNRKIISTFRKDFWKEFI